MWQQFNMTATITENGVHLPKDLFGDASEVEVQSEGGRVVLTPIPNKSRPVPARKKLSIWDLGKDPVATGVTDGARNHDEYIYDGK